MSDNFTNSTSPTSYVDDQDYITQLQQERRLSLICVFVLIACTSVVGLVGNVLVLTVYSRKYRRTATRFLISVIAGVDLFTSVVVMPLQVYTIYHQWGFSDVTTDVICRVTWLAGSFSVMLSGLLLVVVAVVRYRKKYRSRSDEGQCCVSEVKGIVCLVACIALVMSVPHGIVHGSRRVETPRAGVFGYGCLEEDIYVEPLSPLVMWFYSTLLLIAFSSALVIVMSYFKIWKYGRALKVDDVSSDETESKGKRHGDKDNTTNMLFVVSIFYLLTYVPLLCTKLVRILYVVKPLQNPLYAEIFHNLIWLSSAANPIIYSVCDANFRLQCQPLYRSQNKKTKKDYKHNVFIGYADEDFYFVRYVLRKFLEEDLHMSTYIHQRDLRAGYLDGQLIDAIQVRWERGGDEYLQI